MDLTQEVNPRTAVIIIVVVLLGAAVLFWAAGEESKARAGSYFLEHDKRGNLSVQMDHMLMRFSPDGEMISLLDLRDFDAKDVMGNIAYFSNGDFLFRTGEPEAGIKSYFSLAQLPPTMTYRNKYGGSTEIDLTEAEKLREEWVKDLDAESGLNRCDPLTGICDLLVQHNVPWRYRLLIHEENDRIYFTQGTKNEVQILDLRGNLTGSIPVEVKFPKRVRSYENGLFLTDTNNHRVILFDDETLTNVSPRFGSVIAPNHLGRKWPIDAMYFDEHWWVINADSNMTNSHLVIFDSEWSYVEHVTLPDNSDPLDMIEYRGKLIVSDVRLGNLYEFDSAFSSPEIIVLENVAAYIHYLFDKKQLFSYLKYGVIGAIGLFILVFFTVSVRAQKTK